MAKKPKLPTPDENGILNYGIYQRYVGPHKKISFDELDEKLREHCKELEKPATERIKEIREWLFSVLKPHIIGPISSKKAHSEPGYHRPLNDGSGSKIYTLAPGITDKGNASVEAQKVQGALDALYNLNIIAHNLEDGNVDSIVRSSIALGQLIERISIRRFEPLVMSRRRSDAAVDEINSKRPKAEDLKNEAEKAIQEAKVKYPKGSQN